MENVSSQRPYGHRRILTYILVFLIVCLAAVGVFIANQVVGLNVSVEYERSVFINQIAEQMKKNLITNRENNLLNIRRYAEVVSAVQPKTFGEVQRLFPEYARKDTPNWLFFLTSGCELLGIDGVKQWVSLPYEEYFLDVLTNDYTTDFMRIGMKQEFMAYSARFENPVTIEGQEISAILFGWDSSEYRLTLSSKLFEAKSSALMVGKVGNIVIYPEGKDSELYGYNIYSYLQEQGISQEDLQIIRELITGADDSTALCDVGGDRWLLSSAVYDERYTILIMLPIQITSAGTYQNLYGLIIGIVSAFVIIAAIAADVFLTMAVRRKVQRDRELQTEILMKTAQTKNEFLAKMSHDIRTPLNGIIGMNYIASLQLPPESDKAADSLKKVDTAAKYLLGILNDILDMSKIESGELRLALRTFSLEKLLTDIESLMVIQIEGKNLRFSIDAQETDWDSYIGDELRIKQILINLLSNAVKFTEKGSVTLSVHIRPFLDGKDQITFVVSDTGKGMSQEFMNRIFLPFTQEDEGIATQYGGSGLGLSIVKSFIDLMDGTIEVFSELGKGSRFTVTLPLARAEGNIGQEACTVEDKDGYSFAGKRVLLCEDNGLNAEIASMVLNSYGLEVEWVENGKKGVERFESCPVGYFSMIFMDVRMPQMDGYEATRLIRGMQRPDALSVPICALSANAFSEDISMSLKVGMNEHLAKPLDLVQLLGILRKYLTEEGK